MYFWLDSTDYYNCEMHIYIYFYVPMSNEYVCTFNSLTKGIFLRGTAAHSSSGNIIRVQVMLLFFLGGMIWTVDIELHLIGIHLQDDYLDCFGDHEFIGKIERNI